MTKTDIIGRWWITVRSDGSRLGDLNYEPMAQGKCSRFCMEDRLADALRSFVRWQMKTDAGFWE
ncbi:MAG: hypothetical protein R2941_24835 [Desulfobacterales bacterium]